MMGNLLVDNDLDLEDDSPAGPYTKHLLEDKVTELALLVIRQALMDADPTKKNNFKFREPARAFLCTFGHWWLRAMRAAPERWEPSIHQLLYGSANLQLPLEVEDPEEREWLKKWQDWETNCGSDDELLPQNR